MFKAKSRGVVYPKIFNFGVVVKNYLENSGSGTLEKDII